MTKLIPQNKKKSCLTTVHTIFQSDTSELKAVSLFSIYVNSRIDGSKFFWNQALSQFIHSLKIVCFADIIGG